MTPEQREAAIDRAIDAWFYDAALTENNTARERMGLALDAALSGFVVLHRDEVTETYQYGHPAETKPTHSRLVSRWEPITKEDNDA